MLKRHEIEILLKAGHPKTEVARLAGVSARSVQASLKRIRWSMSMICGAGAEAHWKT